ncbi:unnamed protein product [Notodromas monacha]|uniref:Uncharacterized protein n=1 Tax=Notodromas monacha TaxID=399045 RepID=A0A7R9BR43_9CRUS|nr:unnamed protein product [Notodromas monacha]CAG0918784.1 unnamed protein product [Notodromas monacha]
MTCSGANAVDYSAGNGTGIVAKSITVEQTIVSKVVGGVLVSSSVAMGLLSVALALFAGLGSFSRRRRRSLEEEEGFSTMENILHVVELAKEMYDGYDVKSVDCHRRLMCQLSKTEAYHRIGADRAFRLADTLETWLDLPPPIKILVDQLKFAVSFGNGHEPVGDLNHEPCEDAFPECSFSFENFVKTNLVKK